MGKYDLAIKFGKSLLSDTANYVKACGKRSILETKPPIFHGINPTLTYAPSGKSFALPRFCTEEMKQARQMNKIAIHQAKAGEVVRTYPKATPQDLKRLTSETIEDSYSRVEWTNPKDGKVYNLLKQGETKDGKVIVRILDEEGAFIKEAELTQKVHVLIDDTQPYVAFGDLGYFKFKEIQQMSHAELMTIGAKRHNPFEKIILFDVSKPLKDSSINTDKQILQIFDNIKQRIIAGEKIDYISMSRGYDKNLFDSKLRVERLGLNNEELDNVINNTSLKAMINTANKKGIRVLISGSNNGKYFTNHYLTCTRAEGVGAIHNNGKIANYSSSRSSYLTQHYEQSGYPITFTRKGANVTGTTGTDLHINNRFIGKNQREIESMHQNIRDKMTEIEHEADRLVSEGLYTPQKQKELGDKYIVLQKEFDDITLGTMYLNINNDGVYVLPKEIKGRFGGTSLATAIRTAKLALNDMMEGIL